MKATVLEPSKAKTARRVIEVLEFFDEQHRQATVMDIVRRYKRPQSSTSELLASLVDMGLLYKDAGSRHYSLTPRAAILGSLSQPSVVRDGRLSMLIDRLGAESGLGVALFGMVGLTAQIFRWKPGSEPIKTSEPGGLRGGDQERLCDCAAGWLLLSTIPQERREGVLRRMNAEASDNLKFDHPELREQVRECGQQGYAIGTAGFGTSAQMCAVLLPKESGERPIALGFVFEASSALVTEGLIEHLQRSVQNCVGSSNVVAWAPRPMSDAA